MYGEMGVIERFGMRGHGFTILDTETGLHVTINGGSKSGQIVDIALAPNQTKDLKDLLGFHDQVNNVLQRLSQDRIAAKPSIKLLNQGSDSKLPEALQDH